MNGYSQKGHQSLATSVTHRATAGSIKGRRLGRVCASGFHIASRPFRTIPYRYLLQFIAYALWPREGLTSWWELLLFMLFLLSASYLAVERVITSCASWWHKQTPRKLLAVALLTYDGLLATGRCWIAR